MKEHDYAAVRASMEKGVFNHADADTIIHALRFAEKMMKKPNYILRKPKLSGNIGHQVFDS